MPTTVFIPSAPCVVPPAPPGWWIVAGARPGVAAGGDGNFQHFAGTAPGAPELYGPFNWQVDTSDSQVLNVQLTATSTSGSIEWIADGVSRQTNIPAPGSPGHPATIRQIRFEANVDGCPQDGVVMAYQKLVAELFKAGQLILTVDYSTSGQLPISDPVGRRIV